MNFKKISILILSIFVLGAFLSNTSIAQTSQGTTVATVSISNAKIVTQADRDFTLSFDISNKVGAQPDIKYGVQIFQITSTKSTKVDETVYDEVLSLGSNSTISKTINYTISNSIPAGNYKIYIVSKNSSGLPLSISLAGQATIGKSTSDSIQIVKDSCYVVTSTSSKATQYPIDLGFSIAPKDQLILKCKVTSTLANTTFKTNFITKSQTSFGDIVSSVSSSTESVLIKKGTNNITLVLPKASKPQGYNLSISLESAKAISNIISINYVLMGQTGVIQNVVFDKTYYGKGDKASLQIYSTQYGTGTVSVIVTDENNEICSATTTQNANSFSVINLPIKITKDCNNPKANIILAVGDKVLDSKDFNITSNDADKIAALKKDMITKIIVIVIAIIGVLLIGLFVKRSKKSAIMMLIMLAIAGFGFNAKAEICDRDTVYDKTIKYYKTTLPSDWKTSHNINFYFDLGMSVSVNEVISTDDFGPIMDVYYYSDSGDVNGTWTPYSGDKIPHRYWRILVQRWEKSGSTLRFVGTYEEAYTCPIVPSCETTKVVTGGSLSTEISKVGDKSFFTFKQVFDLGASYPIQDIRCTNGDCLELKTIEGSNDNKNWTNIFEYNGDIFNPSDQVTGEYYFAKNDTYSGDNNLFYNSGARKTKDWSYNSNYVTSYRYYRINDSNFGAGGSSIIFQTFNTQIFGEECLSDGLAIKSFTASPNPTVVNTGTTLSWTSEGASTCTLYGGSAGTVAGLSANGSYSTPGLSQDETYQLSCSQIELQKDVDACLEGNPSSEITLKGNYKPFVKYVIDLGNAYPIQDIKCTSGCGSGGLDVSVINGSNEPIIVASNYRAVIINNPGRITSNYYYDSIGRDNLFYNQGARRTENWNYNSQYVTKYRYYRIAANFTGEDFVTFKTFDTRVPISGCVEPTTENITTVTSAPLEVKVYEIDPISINISATPSVVKKGENSTVTWSAEGVDSCTLTREGNQISYKECSSSIQTETVSCPQLSMPSCGSNTIAFGGVDNNGCDLPAKCVFVKCTVYTKPTCSVNERIAPGVEIDPYGCPLPFKCESISSEEYKYVSQFGTSGIDNGMFNYPMGMDIDSSGYLYVADTNNNRIQKFDSDGNFKMTFGSSGIEHGQFNKPRGIDIDSYGNIYVVDTGNNRVQKFDSNGEYILGWNIVPFPVSIGGKFIAPTQIVIDSLGYVYVSDMRNSRVEKFNSDGVYQSHIGSYGTYEGMFIYPRGIDIDFLGNIYVTDIGDFRIQKFNSKGDFITKFGGSGSDNGMFNYPTDIVVDRYENIYVADTNNNRIQKFAKVPANTSTSCNLSGSKIVGNIATTTEITINCVNRNNSSSASTNIEFDPAGICKIYKAGACKVGELFWVGISADPESVNSGSSTMITWEADEADSCSLFKNGNPFNTSSTATSGTVTSGKLTSETTFKVECTKENETLEADVNVTINAPEEEDEPGEGEKNELGVSIKSINASQNGSRIEGDLYVNRNVTWTVESEDKNATRKNRIWKENGNVVSNSESYNKIYTTVGTKTIMVTDVYFKDGVWATTSATISKKVKLDQGSNEEI